MNTCEILYWTIGIIHSEHTIEKNTPIQPVYAKGCKGHVELCPEFVEGLRDLSSFSHIYLIYHFHQVRSVKLLVKPYLQDKEHGIFATRAPFRPNAIGLSVVELLSMMAISCIWTAWTFWMARRCWILNPIQPGLIFIMLRKTAGRTRFMNKPQKKEGNEGIVHENVFVLHSPFCR